VAKSNVSTRVAGEGLLLLFLAEAERVVGVRLFYHHLKKNEQKENGKIWMIQHIYIYICVCVCVCGGGGECVYVTVPLT